jgi:Leucine-rich repeat (LRR) protein
MDDKKIDCSNQQLTTLPNLSIYTNLIDLDCSENLLQKLDNLPNTLLELYCYGNHLTSLDNLPISLKELR